MATASAIAYNIYGTKATEYVRIARGRKLIQIYTDGSCLGNPGPGGWGAVIIEDGRKRTLSGADESTTNNRMELQAVIEGLKALTAACQIELFTDSVYVGKGIQEWMAGWKSRGWKRRQKGRLVPVKNQELWMALDQLLAIHELTYTRVVGHSGHAENERCDFLAVEAYRQHQ